MTSVMGSQQRLQENEAERIRSLDEKGKEGEARVVEINCLTLMTGLK